MGYKGKGEMAEGDTGKVEAWNREKEVIILEVYSWELGRREDTKCKGVCARRVGIRWE